MDLRCPRALARREANRKVSLSTGRGTGFHKSPILAGPEPVCLIKGLNGFRIDSAKHGHLEALRKIVA
jgi:hypothetical protein